MRPRLGALDVMVHLWRAKWLMLGVFAPLAAIGLVGALSLPTTYAATTRVLVSEAIDQDGAGLEAAVRSEVELMRSSVVAETALAQVTLARVYPALARKCAPDTCARLGVAEISETFTPSAAPGSPVISATFTHASPPMSAEMANALVDAYAAYRTNVYAGSVKENPEEQRKLLEANLAEVETAIRDYLRTNNLADLASNRETLRLLHQTASADLLRAQSRLRQANAQLADYREQIVSIPPEVDHFVEDSSGNGLRALKREREEMLSRYPVGSRVVRDLDARIAQAEGYLDVQGAPSGVVRRGANPLYQHVEAAIATLHSEVQALRSQEAELKRQIAAFEDRQRRLFELEPDLQALERRRDAAELALNNYVAREARTLGQQGALSSETVSIRVLEPASEPVEGKSFRLPAMIAALLLAVMAALTAGLVRAFTRRGLATPGSAERTLGLPVLASVQKY